MFKIVTIVGARPQFMKAAVVSHALRKKKLNECVVHTGQHFDTNMSDVFFDELGILPPKYFLNIGGGSHGENTGRMIEAIEKALMIEKPDLILVFGDTDSTLAGTLAAVKLHIPVAHIESGLRSFNRYMPEEVNRVLTDHAASILFAPTSLAVKNLKNEGIANTIVKCTGDVMFDCALFYGEKAEKTSKVLSRLKIKSDGYVLATVHRAENTDDAKRLEAIFEGFSIVELNFILPLHPRTSSRLKMYSIEVPDNVHIIEPVGYLDMVMLEKNASLIVTDSGGVQKEAFFYHVPCVTLRDETEWVELVDSGWNYLASPKNGAQYIAEVMSNAVGRSGDNVKPYGSGNSAELIVEEIIKLSLIEK